MTSRKIDMHRRPVLLARLRHGAMIVAAAWMLWTPSAPTLAATSGFFIQGDVNLAMGASTLSAANSKLGGGGGRTIYQLANDGRFGFGAGIGYLHGRFGVRLRYVSLGTQPVFTVNGTARDVGTGVRSDLLALEGLYLVPVASHIDLVLIGGAGALRTNVPIVTGGANGSTGESRKGGRATQYEPALSLGVGLRIAVTKRIAAQIEVSRITPVQSGLRHRGFYNNGQTIVSTSVSYVF